MSVRKAGREKEKQEGGQEGSEKDMKCVRRKEGYRNDVRKTGIVKETARE